MHFLDFRVKGLHRLKEKIQRSETGTDFYFAQEEIKAPTRRLGELEWPGSMRVCLSVCGQFQYISGRRGYMVGKPRSLVKHVNKKKLNTS